MPRRATALAGLSLLLIGAAAPQGVHDHTTRSLRIGPGVPIHVTATVGDIELVAWDRPEIAIDISRLGPTEDALHEIPVSIAVQGSGLLVDIGQRNDGRDARIRGSVTIHAPAGQPVGPVHLFEGRLTARGLRGGLRARLDRGSIEADVVDGSVHLETVMGDVHVTHAGTVVRAPVRVRTFNGDITVKLRRAQIDLRILALSLGGQVISNIPLTLRTGLGPRFGETTLGRGEPVVSLDAVNGDVRIDTY